MSGKIEIPPTFLHPNVSFEEEPSQVPFARIFVRIATRNPLRFDPRIVAEFSSGRTRRITRRYIHNRNYGEGEEGSLGNSWVFRRERGELGPRDNVVEVEDSRPFGPARYPRIVTLNWPADIGGLRVRFFSLPPSLLELLYQQATSGKNFLGPGRTILRASRLIVSNQLPLSEFQ